MRYSTIAAALALQTSALIAQNPGQNVRVDVAVSSIATIGDTTGMSYLVSNLATSTERLWIYNVDAPGGVRMMATSTGSFGWRTWTQFGDRTMAGWMFLPDYLAPGATSPALHFEAIGLPGIQTYWAGGYFPLPENEADPVADSTVFTDPFVTDMINGQTIGIDPWPTDRSAQALLARLRTLTQRSCSAPLNWITDSSLCNQLFTDLDQVEYHRSNGQAAQAKEVLIHYESLVSSGSAAGTVKNPSYWLLKSNGQIVGANL